jgi:ATP-dependent Clp protease ATP-binding subunit ClpC
VGFSKSPEITQDITDNIITESVKKHFSPEFLNRIDEIVLFSSLNKTEVRKIAEIQLAMLPIKVTKPLVDFVVEHGYSAEYGARNIARFIKNNITDKIADAVLNKLIPKKEGDYYMSRIVKGSVKIIDTKKYNVSSS